MFQSPREDLASKRMPVDHSQHDGCGPRQSMMPALPSCSYWIVERSSSCTCYRTSPTVMFLRFLPRTGLTAIIGPLIDSTLQRGLSLAIWRPIFTLPNKTSSTLQRLPTASAQAACPRLGSVTNEFVPPAFLISIVLENCEQPRALYPGDGR